MPLLIEQEIAFFKVNGYVIKRGAIDSDAVAMCRDNVWANIPESKDDPESWTDGAHAVFRTLKSDDAYSPWALERPFVEMMELQRPFAEQMLGDKLVPPTPGYVMLRFPSGETQWNPPDSGHLDSTWGTSMATGVLLDTVEPKGGGYTVWPGSHLMHHQVFLNRDVKTSPISMFGPSPWPTGTGVEVTGEAGDLVVIHPWLLHTVGHNITERVRMILLTGWRRVSIKQDYDNVGPDLWWYWDGMKSIEQDLLAQNLSWPVGCG
jgi:hypothetical protein